MSLREPPILAAMELQQPRVPRPRPRRAHTHSTNTTNATSTSHPTRAPMTSHPVQLNLSHWLPLRPKTTPKIKQTTPTKPAAKYHRQLQIQPATTTYSANNLPWGDTVHIKPDDCTRFYFQNINSMGTDTSLSKALEYGSHLHTNQVDCAGIAETNVSWNSEMRKRCRSIWRGYWPQVTLSTSNSDFHLGTISQPGGTATLLTGPLVSRVAQLISDPSGLGRWSGCTLRGRKSTYFTVITAYQPPQTSLSQSKSRTAYFQQWSLLKQKGIQQPNPRQAFSDDLTSFIASLTSANHEVLLMFDANAYPTQKGSVVQRLIDAGMDDLHALRHGAHNDPPTYRGGKHRIDYILATAGVNAFVRTAGIEPLNKGFFTDHRGLFVDIQLTGLLRGDIPDFPIPDPRGIATIMPSNVIKYRDTLQTYLNDHNMLQRMTEVQAMTPGPAQMTILDQLDQDLTRGMIAAENSCRKVPRAPFSPTLLNARRMTTYWRLWISELRTGNDNSELRRIILQFHAPADFAPPDSAVTLSIARKGLEQANEHLKTVLLTAATIRNDWLQQRADEEAATGNHSVESILRRIRQAEAQRGTFSKLRSATKPGDRTGLSHILIPGDSPDTWEPVFDAQELTRRLIERNQTHFHQAYGTPFTTAPLETHVGWSGTTAAAQEILRGQYPVETLEIPEAAQSILTLLRSHPSTPSITTHVTPTELTHAYKRWRESTSTSPSGRHLGHYKALTGKWDIPTTEGATTSQQFMQLHSDILNLSVQNNYILSRWRKVASTMLEKIPGQPRLDKLRVIHIAEADMNLLLGIWFGRRLMRNAETHNLLGEEQWGSRKGRQASDVAFLKRLTYTVFNLTRQSGGTFDNDAKACYDRIVPNLALMRSQQLGMPRNTCEFVANLLSQLRYHVKTRHGTSTEYYEPSPSRRQYGSGQGFRSSPGIWTIVSTLLLQAVPEKNPGIQFVCPTGELSAHRHMDAYVDDTTVWVNTPLTEFPKPEQIQDTLKRAAQWWENLLTASGGALELTKCFYYLFHWIFDARGNARLAMPRELPPPLTLADTAFHRECQIELRASNIAHKTLGVMLAPNDSDRAEARRLQEKASKFSSQLGSIRLAKHEVWTAYRSLFLPAHQYSLGVTALSEQELQQIESQPTATFLRKLGYNSHLPRAIAFAPSQHGGVGLLSLVQAQGMAQVSMCLKHLRQGGPTGDLLLLGMRWFQHFSGLDSDVFSQPDIILPHVPGAWFHSLRNYLVSTDSSLRWRSNPIPRPRCLGDKCIMRLALAARLPPHQLRIINHCRLTLQATYTSDVCDAQGTELFVLQQDLPSFTSFPPPTERWPRQDSPASPAWRFWYRFLRIHLCQSSESNKLRRPLGLWTNHASRRRTAYYDSTNHRALIFLDDQVDQWRIHPIIRKLRRYWTIGSSTGIFHGPVDPAWLPADRWADSGIGIPAPIASTSAPPSPGCFLSIPHLPSLSLPRWEQNLLYMCQTTPDVNPIHELAPAAGTRLLLASDGSVNSTHGTYGWVLGTTTANLWEGRGVVRGSPIQSFRAEAYGLLAGLRFVHHMSNTTLEGRKIPFDVFLDSKTLLSKYAYFPILHQRNPTSPDYDVLSQIDATVASMHLQPSFHYVKGHQVGREDELTRSAQMNVRADSLARTFLHEVSKVTTAIPMLRFPACAAYVLHGKITLTSNEARQLATLKGCSDLALYLCHRNQWDVGQYQSYDWQSRHRALIGLPESIKRFLTKALCRWLPVCSRLHRLDPTHPSACPSCGIEETHEHIITCANHQQWRNHISETIYEFLRGIQTCPRLTRIITIQLGLWFHTPRPPESPLTRECYRFFCGIIPRSWTQRQGRYAAYHPAAMKRNRTPSHWAAKLMKHIWSDFHDLWLQRCNELHNTQPTHQTHRRSLAETRVRSMYTNSADLPAADREFFDRPIENVIQWSTNSMEAWIRAAEIVLKQGKKAQSQRRKASQPDIRDFFPDFTL